MVLAHDRRRPASPARRTTPATRTPMPARALDAATATEGDDASDEGDAAPTQAMVRFAQLSPDAPPLDVCLAPRGTGDYKGPMLAAARGERRHARRRERPRAVFTKVSAYFAIDPGAYDVRLVPAGATSCTPGAADAGSADASAGADAGADADAGTDADAGAGADASAGAGADADAETDAGVDAGPPAGPTLPLPPDTTNLPAFVAGHFATVLLVGDLAPVGGDAPFRMAAVQDDASLAGGGASLRAINALPAVPRPTSASGRRGARGPPSSRTSRSARPASSAAPSQGNADANGYLPIAPFGPGAFSVRASGDAAGDIASSQRATVSPGRCRHDPRGRRKDGRRRASAVAHPLHRQRALRRPPLRLQRRSLPSKRALIVDGSRAAPRRQTWRTHRAPDDIMWASRRARTPRRRRRRAGALARARPASRSSTAGSSCSSIRTSRAPRSPLASSGRFDRT